MQITQYLDQILQFHSNLGSPLANQLQPGLGEDEIRSKISSLPFRMSQEFIDLYRWRDGVPMDHPNAISLFEFHHFVPLDETLSFFHQTYAIMKGFYPIADWLMVFQDPASDGYGLMGGEVEEASSPVVFLFEGEGVQIVFDNLNTMLKTIVACFEEGVFWMAGDGNLETDYDQFGQVALRLSPDIPYWRQYVDSS